MEPTKYKKIIISLVFGFAFPLALWFPLGGLIQVEWDNYTLESLILLVIFIIFFVSYFWLVHKYRKFISILYFILGVFSTITFILFALNHNWF